MNIQAYHIFVFFLICPFLLNAQSRSSIDYTQLLEQLEGSARKGEKRSLRDLGSLLDRPETSQQALSIIKKLSLFTDAEINLKASVSKSKFHSFYYDNEKEIQFSEIIGAYFITSLEKRKIKFEIRNLNEQGDQDAISLNAIKKRIDQAIKEKNQGLLIQQIELLTSFQNNDANALLLETSNQIRSSSNKWSQDLYHKLSKGLSQSRDLGCLQEILSLAMQKKISPAFAETQLLRLTNIKMKQEVTLRNLSKTYKHYVDSLGTIEEMRSFGYRQIFNFQPNFFNHIVDYYGRILCFADDREWLIHNATQDLIISRHPRSLFYLAAMGYKNSQVLDQQKGAMSKMVNVITRLTNIEVGVENVKRGIDYKLNDNSDQIALENYLTYWASKYNDYEWDEARNSYVNKYNALEKTQSYEKLFRRLNSRNDSVAMASFSQLTEGEPSEIIALAEKYRQMFRSYNQTLPPFKYKYLEQLSSLTQYCKNEGISYKPERNLLDLLNKLYTEEDEVQRYQLENQLINSMELKDITAIEYWGCINQSSLINNYSLGRILDIYYSKSWEAILKDPQQIRLYLKKSLLLANIGVIGVCNNYLNKFDITDPKVKKILNEIYATEVDRQIQNQILQLIAQDSNDSGSELSDFVTSPMQFNKREIKILPKPSSKELKQIIRNIQSNNDNNSIKKLFYYLRLHPSMEHVPLFFELAEDQRILYKKRGMELTVGDNVTPIIENIFNYNFPDTNKDKLIDISPWLALWKKDKGNYKNWADQFFEKKIEQLDDLDELSIDDINLITESPNYSAKYKHACLEALKKVKPFKGIRSLSIEPKLSLTEDLKYFESFDYSYKLLDDIPKLFEIDSPSIMLQFLIRKSEQFDLSKKGSLFNNLFRYPWFENYVHSGKATQKEVDFVQNALGLYLDESDYLSEFEEQTTTLHLAQLQNIGKPLEERILSSIRLSVDPTSKAKIQQTIISTISYDEIGIIAKHFNDLAPTLGKEPWAFLRKDFGLPIFKLGSQKEYDAFMKNHKEMTEYDFYVHYLSSFGIDFMNSKNELDFQKIYEILEFDAVTPFVAGGGGKRDYYTYGIIKILELKFDTTLDFHKKLNENQSFYSFSTAKRSDAWINYLVDKKLININTGMAPSFTLLVE